MGSDLHWTTQPRRVTDLVAYDKNPRLLTEKQKRDLTASIEKFNLVEIPAINFDNTLIAGHQRCKILLLLGRGDEIVDVRVPNRLLTEGELKEYNIRSNANTGSWDLSLLEENFDMAALESWGLDYDKAVRMNKVMEVDMPDQILGEMDEVPNASLLPPLIKRGDIFTINNHRIMCGDSRIPDEVDLLMRQLDTPVLADIVFTDPPYNVAINDIANLGKTQHTNFICASGEMSSEEFTSFLSSVFLNLVNYSKEGSIHYICMDWKHMVELLTASKDHYGELKNLCIWVKDNGGMGTFYRSRHELVFVFKKGTGSHINNFELGQYGRYRTNVWEYMGAFSMGNPNKEDSKLHPTVKPTQMVTDVLLDCSRMKAVVSDLFLGSGTTLIAAEQVGRRCYGMELSPVFMEVIIRRFYNYMTNNHKPIAFKHENGGLLLQDIIGNI